MIIGTLALIGFGAGLDQLRQDNRLLAFWAISVCSLAFIVNLI